MSQANDIRDFLLSGHTITPLEALQMFGCISLGQRIFELKDKGWDLRFEWEKQGKKKWKRWRIEGDNVECVVVKENVPAIPLECTFDPPVDFVEAMREIGLNPIVIDENTKFVSSEEESVPEDVSSTPDVSPCPKHKMMESFIEALDAGGVKYDIINKGG